MKCKCKTCYRILEFIRKAPNKRIAGVARELRNQHNKGHHPAGGRKPHATVCEERQA